MGLQCNIDARGKLARLIWGMLCLLAGVLGLVFWALSAGGWVAWTASLAAIAFGAFALFEARAGWCAVRAMGFRTRM